MGDNIEHTKKILEGMDTISLAEMDSVTLMNRMDTKCIFSTRLLHDILDECRNDYRVLFHQETRMPFYKTLYFDSSQLDFYKDHHNGREKRFKIRMRNYTESHLFFLEIKYKRYGRTDKKRIKINNFHEELTRGEYDFLENITQSKLNLNPVLWNAFNRITLVNKHTPERVTIDTGINFTYGTKDYQCKNLVIGEIKQERASHRSPIFNLLKKHGVRPAGMSKYCLGIALLNNKVKHNNFKERILAIEKLS